MDKQNRIYIGQQIKASGIDYLSFSSMKELRNNEALFLKHYINYEWDNNIYLATIIGKSCHHGVETFYGDPENKILMEEQPQLVMEKITKSAKDYAKDNYITKYQKPEDFWIASKMIEFGGYDDVRKLVDEYKAKMDEIKAMTTDEVDAIKKMEEDAETIAKKIKKAIEKHKDKDAKLDNFVNWGATGSIEKIFDGITYGMGNWLQEVYPIVKNWKLIGVELERTLELSDLAGEILEVPVKFIIDAVFEDEKGDLIIVDWKFKGSLSDDTSIKPEYDMQGTTYFFGGMTAFERKPKKAIFIEIQPGEKKAPYMQQAELRDLCGKNGIDWEKGNNGKYMTNAMMTDELLAKKILELKPVVYQYVIDFEEKPYLLTMWEIFYHQTTQRLYELLVEEKEFIPNIFDASFDGGVIAYQEWMAQFMPKGDEPEYTDEDAVDL